MHSVLMCVVVVSEKMQGIQDWRDGPDLIHLGAVIAHDTPHKTKQPCGLEISAMKCKTQAEGKLTCR